MIDEAPAAGGPGGGLGHVHLDARLMNKSQPFQMAGHDRLAPRYPDMAQVGDVLALLFRRLHGFFCVSDRAREAPSRLRHCERRCCGFKTSRPPIRRA